MGGFLRPFFLHLNYKKEFIGHRMQIITSASLEQYANTPALFFTETGIIINNQTTHPLLPIESLSQFQAHAYTIYFSDPHLIVKFHHAALENLPSHLTLHPVRSFLASLQNMGLQRTILRAVHWLTWDATVQFCSHCGGKLMLLTHTIEKKCTLCEQSFFPNLSPAIMVLIQRENTILLGRSAHFTPGVYSALAGFIDLGETAEEAVHREVKEEVGLEITQLQYFQTQSWPFPNSFMIAFTAQYLSGEMRIDTHELEDAQWFNKNHLPKLPSYASISRRLIESVL